MSHTVPQTAAACSLAEVAYYLAAQYHGRAILPWDRLTPQERNERVEAAAVVLDEMRPSRGISLGPDYFQDSEELAEAVAGRLLTFLRPGAPYGEPA